MLHTLQSHASQLVSFETLKEWYYQVAQYEKYLIIHHVQTIGDCGEGYAVLAAEI